MASLPVDNLKSEKAKAFKVYQRQQKFTQVMRLFNLFLALFFFCRSSLLPIVVEFCSRFYSETISFFSNSIYVFIIGNAIIMFIYILTQQDGHNNSVADAVCDRYFSLNKSFASSGDRSKSECEPKSLLKTDSNGEPPEPFDKQSIPMEFSPEKQGGSFSDKCLKEDPTAETETPKVGVGESRYVKEKVTAITQTTMTTFRMVTSTASIEKVSEVQKSYKSVQSVSYKRRLAVKPGGRELQRRNTETGSRSELVRYSRAAGAESQRRMRCVEDMSNEEFNRTVEDFIAKQKKKQKEEHATSQYLSLTSVPSL